MLSKFELDSGYQNRAVARLRQYHNMANKVILYASLQLDNLDYKTSEVNGV